jgi:hypothetical protein
VYWILTTGLFLYRIRHDAMLRARSVVLCMTLAVTTLMTCVIFFLVSTGTVPCFLSLWSTYLTLPLFMLIFLVRAWRLIVMAKLQRRILGMRPSQLEEGSEAVIHPSDQPPWPRERGKESSATEDRLTMRIFQHRRRVSERRLSLLLLMIFAGSACLLCVLQWVAPFPYRLMDPAQYCPITWHFIPAYAFIFLCAWIIGPVTAWRIRQMYDPFKVRRDILVMFYASIPLLILFVLMSYWGNPVIAVLRPTELTALLFVVTHTTTMTIPAVQSWKQGQAREQGSVGEGEMYSVFFETEDWSTLRQTAMALSAVEHGQARQAISIFEGLERAPTKETVDE